MTESASVKCFLFKALLKKPRQSGDNAVIADALGAELIRGTNAEQPSFFSYSQTADFVPANSPLRRIRSLLDASLASINRALTTSYSHTGRPGIAPEHLIRASPLQVLYSIRPEHQLIERLRYNMLFCWFVGLSLDGAVLDATTFTKNRQRLIDDQVHGPLLDPVVDQARRRQLLSEQHVCVDGTLIDAWASMGSYRRTGDDTDPPSGPPNFKGESRRADTHECKTEPDARLYKKFQGQPSRPCYTAHVLTDNRYALVVDAQTTHAHGAAEVDAALATLDRRLGKRRPTVGADKNYDRHRFVRGARAARVTPHGTQNNRGQRSAIDRRTTRHAGYAQSINSRHRVETPFGWGRCALPLKQTMLRGLDKAGGQAELVFASYNLARIAALETT